MAVLDAGRFGGRAGETVGYEQIEHTADVGLRVWASTLDELFIEAAHALFSVMGRPRSGAERRLSIRLDAPDVEALLVDWLSELLYVFEGKDLVPARVEAHVSEAGGGWRVEAVVSGPAASSFAQHGPAVKAVTYHRLSVARTDHGWEARVYLDV